MNGYQQAAAKPCSDSLARAQAHQRDLTKPIGALGQLETLSEQFAAWQGCVKPSLDQVCVRVFAGDHGICAQNISAFPQAVTGQMIANFSAGGAAISVLSRDIGADFSVINMGVASDFLDMQGVVNYQLMAGTHDFSQQAAMPNTIVEAALKIGAEQVLKGTQLCIGGDMGIGNTSSASAIYCALLNISPELAVGPGTGVDQQGIQRKQAVIAAALHLHQARLSAPMDVLACVGGLEIAGLTGYYIAAAQQGVPVLVDGFISTAAALLACNINPSVRQWLLFAHQSAEPAHVLALQAMDAKPLLNLGLRLGEGSGAALAVSLIRSALSLHNNMATFSQAGVNSGT